MVRSILHFSASEKADKLGNLPVLLQALARLVALKRLGVLLFVLEAALCMTTSTTSAHEHLQTKTHAEHRAPQVRGRHRGGHAGALMVASARVHAGRRGPHVRRSRREAGPWRTEREARVRQAVTRVTAAGQPHTPCGSQPTISPRNTRTSTRSSTASGTYATSTQKQRPTTPET